MPPDQESPVASVGVAYYDDVERLIPRLVTHYRANRHLASSFRDQLESPIVNHPGIKEHIHFIKHRMKDEEHLESKLRRKLSDCRDKQITYPHSLENLFMTVNDLAGIRIIHLHSDQLRSIHAGLLEIVDEYRFELIESFARTWDDESREFYASLDLRTETSPTMYTSVHYIIGSRSKSQMTVEVQVRTLAEELWGEVDHSINYPVKSTSDTCREQIRVLARLVSSCTRLVDSIFNSDLAERVRASNATAPAEPDVDAAGVSRAEPVPSGPKTTKTPASAKPAVRKRRRSDTHAGTPSTRTRKKA